MGTLQVLTYWRMGLHSRYPVYRSIRRLGLWNPRLDTAWLLDVDRIGDRRLSRPVMSTCRRRVIGGVVVR